MNQAQDTPDKLPVYDASGKLICWRPNYDKPGVFEQVQRDAFETECAAKPPTSNVDTVIRIRQIARFEAQAALAQHVFFGAQQNPSDDTWSAIKVYRDGNPIVLDDGFKTQDEAEDCAELARETELVGA